MKNNKISRIRSTKNDDLICLSPTQMHPILQIEKKNRIKLCSPFNIERKRCLLPFLGLISLITIEELRTYVYLPIIISFISFILFYNFPSLLYVSNMRPIYYEDLFVDSPIFSDSSNKKDLILQPNIKKKFENQFKWVLIITNTLFMGLLADYWLYKTYNDDFRDYDHEEFEINGFLIEKDYFEIVGVTGGVLNIFKFINSTLGSILLENMQKKMKRERKHLRNLTKIKKARPINKKIKHTVDNVILNEIKIDQTLKKKTNKRIIDSDDMWRNEKWDTTFVNNDDNIVINVKRKNRTYSV